MPGINSGKEVEPMSTSKIKLKNRANGRIVYSLKCISRFGHISYILIAHFCTYCGYEGLIEGYNDKEGMNTYRCPACGIQQWDEVRPHIDRDEWEEIPNDNRID